MSLGGAPADEHELDIVVEQGFEDRAGVERRCLRIAHRSGWSSPLASMKAMSSSCVARWRGPVWPPITGRSSGLEGVALTSIHSPHSSRLWNGDVITRRCLGSDARLMASFYVRAKRAAKEPAQRDRRGTGYACQLWPPLLV